MDRLNIQGYQHRLPDSNQHDLYVSYLNGILDMFHSIGCRLLCADFVPDGSTTVEVDIPSVTCYELTFSKGKHIVMCTVELEWYLGDPEKRIFGISGIEPPRILAPDVRLKEQKLLAFLTSLHGKA